MNPQLLPAQLDPDVPAWTQTVQAFLAEKHRRSGSQRTVEGCARMLWPFLSRMNLAATNPCDARERPKTIPSIAGDLTAEQIRELLAVVPDTVAGRRDRALLLRSSLPADGGQR
jgi:site-specific recombinase XerD